ncbi:hypothetical protein [Streptomyces sp. KL116D]|uniref:hypothetical protein n=1 Tax=Streptomyces sp. KL116D TaxID=3045152 RepID=UPI003557454F
MSGHSAPSSSTQDYDDVAGCRGALVSPRDDGDLTDALVDAIASMDERAVCILSQHQTGA